MLDPLFSPSVRAGLRTGVVAASLLLAVPGLATAQSADTQTPQPAQTSAPAESQAPAAAAPAPDAGAAVPAPAQAQPAGGTAQAPAAANATLTSPDDGKGKVKQSKDTRKALKRERRAANAEKAVKENPLAGQDTKLPDKALYDKAQIAMKKGKYDVARLDLQTLLNTYPDSQYQMRAKLAFADSWYKEGGTAALTQAEAEYSDFRVFFPNTPEAAEAQMRIGDIYFRQMDKPDRDYAKATHAEEEYRRMLTDYPDSKLVSIAKQRLREVQEALATREAGIGQYYSTRENWPATIARYQTVADSYPLYSHMDEVLMGLGDAYAAEARAVRAQRNMPEAPKARLEKIYDDEAASAYRKVVMEHAAAPRVEDARDRLAAMNMPIPAPTPEQIQASQALENSRAQYRLQDRAKLLFFHQPDVVLAARSGDPTLADPKATLAPEVTKKLMADFTGAMNPSAAAANGGAPAPATTAADGSTPAAPGATTPAAPLAFQDVPSSDASGATGVNETTPAAASPASTGAAGTSLGVEVLTPGATATRNATVTTAPGASTGNPTAPSSSTTTATPGAARSAEGDNYGLGAVKPVNNSALPPIEKAGPAPDAVNDITPGSQPAAQAANPNKKKQSSPGFDKSDESSSKHKKKKGLNKVNPF